MSTKKKRGFFHSLSRIQLRFYPVILLLALCLTIVFAYHGQKVSFESDISKEMPNNKEIFRKDTYFKENIKGSQTVMISYAVDEQIPDNPIERITDIKVIQSIYTLDGHLRELNDIQDTMSLGEVFKKARVYPHTQAMVDRVLEDASSHIGKFVSDDRKATIIVIYVDNLDSKEDTDAFVETLQEKIDRSNPPYGVKTIITGNPILTSELQGYMKSDYYSSIMIAILLITLFLLLITRRIKKTLLILIPLLLGMTWYAGIIQLSGLELTISTIATGAMVLGLGVEYSIFTYNKFEKVIEEQGPSAVKEATHEAVGFTGRAIFGSAMTTTVAFLSLVLSVIPLLSHLGVIAAIGILSILVNAIVINPCILIMIERVKAYNASLS